jgi:acyl carrier protein
MTRDEINRQVIEIIAMQMGEDGASIDPSVNLIDDLDFDEYGVVGLAAEFEYEFDIDIGDEEMGTFRTVGDIQNHISDLLQVE